MEIIITVLVLCAVSFMLGGAYQKQRDNAELDQAWEDYYDHLVFHQVTSTDKCDDLSSALRVAARGDTHAQAMARANIEKRRQALIDQNKDFDWFGPGREQQKERELRLVQDDSWPDAALEALAGEHIVRSVD